MASEGRTVAIAALLVGAAQAVAFSGVRVDDAYITLRYAENLARGRGFVFNAGERLLGTTSPGHALVGAVVYLVVGHAALPAVASGLGALGWAAQGWLVHRLLRPALGSFIAAAAAIAVAAGAARSYLFVPLETNLVAALVLGAFVLAMRRRWVPAGVVLGVAVVTRADAVLAGGPLFVLAALEVRGAVWKPAAAFAALPLAWATFARLYFGSLWPHTLHAKAFSTTVAAYAAHVLALPVAVLPVSRGGDSLAGGVAIWALAAGGWALAAARDRRLAAVPAYATAHAAAYLVLRPDVSFEWHLYPLGLYGATGAVVAVAALVGRLPRRSAAAAVAAGGFALAWNAWTFRREAGDLYWYGARDAIDREVAAFLLARADPGDVVDAEEVGTLAYDTDLPMLDHPGLVTPFERAMLDRGDAAGHCRALSRLPRLRFVVMNRFELESHRCLFEGASVTHFQHAAIHDFERPPLLGKWELWVADRGARQETAPAARAP